MNTDLIKMQDNLVCTIEEYREIHVKNICGSTKTFLVPKNTRISSFKYMVQDVFGHPYEYVFLIFAGKKLVNDRTIEDYRLCSGCTLQLIWKYEKSG